MQSSSNLETYRQRMGSRAFERRQKWEPMLDTLPNRGAYPTFLRLKYRLGMLITQILLKSTQQYDAALNETHNLSLEKNEINLGKTTDTKTLNLLHLSDLHLDSDLNLADRIIDQIKTLKYDFTVITGDFFNSYEIPSEAALDALHQILNAIQSPAFGCLGNHDLLQTAAKIEAMGVKLLINESVILPFQSKRIQITGIDDPHLFKTDDLQYALESATTDANLKILLSHSPNHLNRAANNGFQIMLSGHTHGGQICLRDGKPIVGNGSANRETISGAWSYKNVCGYTSRGAGTGRTPFRLNCTPEITLHTIKF